MQDRHLDQIGRINSFLSSAMRDAAGRTFHEMSPEVLLADSRTVILELQAEVDNLRARLADASKAPNALVADPYGTVAMVNAWAAKGEVS